jgi:uncharacterized protein (DUF362 family)
MKPRVAIVQADMGPEEAVQEAIDLLGNIDNIFKTGETYLLKPNLFSAKVAESGATTDMRVVLGIAKLLHEQGCKTILGECPAAFHHTKPLRADVIFDELGIRNLCRDNKIDL